MNENPVLEEGVKAAKERQRRDYNPYKDGSSREEWFRGYDSVGQNITIEDWSVAFGFSPEVGQTYGCAFRLSGAVYGHPVHPDGHRVTTSPILGIKEDRIVTWNREYILGTVDPAYEKAYPLALSRLLRVAATLKGRDQ